MMALRLRLRDSETSLSVVDTARAVLTELIGPPEEWPFTVRLWDGSTMLGAANRGAHATLILRDPGALRRMLVPPSELTLGEAYVRGDFDVEGDFEVIVGVAPTIAMRLRSPSRLLRLASLLRGLQGEGAGGDRPRRFTRALGTRHSRHRDARAIRFHYDVGNEFYALWLDRRQIYSCAYFRRPDDDLDTAQEAKLEHICRKLRLRPGERLLDIGAGFGGLIRYAAVNFGVHATGITLSPAQASAARQAIAADGLEDNCQVLVRDYRELSGTEEFDKIVSVGMVEHVGRGHLPEYFAQAHRLLKPGGLFLNHGIVDLARTRLNLSTWTAAHVWRPGEFIQRYVFPDGELVSPAELLAPAEEQGFETRDLESLREHYSTTLRHWVRRLEARRPEAVRLVGEQQYRIFHLYLTGSALGFLQGRMGIVQVLFGKRDRQGAVDLPRTREDIYRPIAGPPASPRG